MKKAVNLLFIFVIFTVLFALTGCQLNIPGRGISGVPEEELELAEIVPVEEWFLASDGLSVTVYEKNEEGILVPSGTRFRGEKVQTQGDILIQDGLSYAPLKDSEEKTYYLVSDLVKTIEECVPETEKFVRTSATTYIDPNDCTIAGFIRKGAHLETIGFDFLKDGVVNMYRAKDDSGSEFWIFNKYLADTKEEADSVNTEFYEYNKDMVFSFDLYGGSPANLDYFPYQSDLAVQKEMPSECRTYYLNVASVDAIDTYIDICKTANANAIVLDIKDYSLAYPSGIAEEYSPAAYQSAYHDNASYKAAIDKLKSEGIWTIGRIVVFNDPLFAEDNPDECIFDGGVNQGWPSAYSRKAWEYNVKLAVSAVEEMGFDEIQFDYVRFPESAYSMSKNGTADFKNTYDEEKAEAIQNFCFYAADMIHRAGAYFSVDVFGECSDGYVTAYGQYWPAISNIADAISSMPYIDHFGRDVDTWSDGYSTMNNWAQKAAAAQGITPNPALPRTWITCYAVPHWDPQIPVTDEFLTDQIRALWDAGIGYGGFITWNAASNTDVYYTVAPAFAREY